MNPVIIRGNCAFCCLPIYRTSSQLGRVHSSGLRPTPPTMGVYARTPCLTLPCPRGNCRASRRTGPLREPSGKSSSPRRSAKATRTIRRASRQPAAERAPNEPPYKPFGSRRAYVKRSTEYAAEAVGQVAGQVRNPPPKRYPRAAGQPRGNPYERSVGGDAGRSNTIRRDPSPRSRARSGAQAAAERWGESNIEPNPLEYFAVNPLTVGVIEKRVSCEV